MTQASTTLVIPLPHSIRTSYRGDFHYLFVRPDLVCLRQSAGVSLPPRPDREVGDRRTEAPGRLRPGQRLSVKPGDGGG